MPDPLTEIEFPRKSVSATTFRVQWKAAKGSRDYYEVNITPTEGVTGKTEVTNLLVTEYIFSGLVPGTEYTVSVVSVANVRKSEALLGTVITSMIHTPLLSFSCMLFLHMHSF